MLRSRAHGIVGNPGRSCTSQPSGVGEEGIETTVAALEM